MRTEPGKRLLIATGNPSKLARLRWVVEGLPFEILSPAEQPGIPVPDVPEDGSSFGSNALMKAQAWSLAAGGMLTLASDGGMVIPALADSWDALRTRRNAGDQATSGDRIQYLLGLMQGLHGEDRRASWHEAIAIASMTGETPQLETAQWELSGDGGLIVGELPAGTQVDAFWTESIRFYPSVHKLYRDLSIDELEQLDQVWPQLRRVVRDYLQQFL